MKKSIGVLPDLGISHRMEQQDFAGCAGRVNLQLIRFAGIERRVVRPRTGLLADLCYL